MPKAVKKELSKKLLHPKSRKAKQIVKQSKRTLSREKSKLVTQIKQNAIGERLMWFRDHLEPDVTVYTPELLRNLIKLYLDRFEEELEQIKIKHSIGNRKNRQHASREDIIKLTKLRDENDYATCGIELPDIINPKQLHMLRGWNGELHLLPNFKMKRFNQKLLLPTEESVVLEKPNPSNVSSRTIENKAENTADSERKEDKLMLRKAAENNTTDEETSLKDEMELD